MRRSAERERLEKSQHAFVSTVSHELRTPLTAIDGSLVLVDSGAAGPLPDKARQLIAIARRNSRRLVTLVNDILEIERLEAGLVELHVESVDLRRLAEQSLEINQPYAARTGTSAGAGGRARSAEGAGRCWSRPAGADQSRQQCREILAARLAGPCRGSPAR